MDRGVSGRQENDEAGREINVLISQRDEDAAPGLADLAIELWVENRVDGLDIFHQQGIAKPQCCLQILQESGVNKRRFGNAAVSILFHQESRGLTGGINYQRVAVEVGEHDGVLDAKLVGRQRVGLPTEPVVRGGEIVDQRQALGQRDLAGEELASPFGEQGGTVRVVEEADVGQEGGGDEDVADYGGHAGLELVGLRLPASALGREVLEHLDGPAHLVLDDLHLLLDQLRGRDQLAVLLLVAVAVRLQARQLRLQTVQLVRQLLAPRLEMRSEEHTSEL